MRLPIILSSVAAVVSAQGVTQYIAPKGKAPKNCQMDLSGKYELSVAPMAKKEKRMAFEASQTLQVTLKNGVLTDALSRTGYIASNYQFQFDGPPQAGSLYTGGWSLCNNGSLALGASTVFYQCLSGSFYNLYDRWWAAQCNPINIVAHSLEAASPAPPAPPANLPPTTTPDVLQSGSPDLPLIASPSSPAKATGNTAGASAVTNGPDASVTPTVGGPASSLASLDSSISSASSSVSSSAARSLASASSSIRSSASTSRSGASASASSSANNGIQVGGTGASTVALLVGVLGVMLA